MAQVVGIDIGGSTIKSALAKTPRAIAETQLHDVRRTTTPVGDAGALVASVIELVASYGPGTDAVGLVMPGLLDVPNGRIRIAGNLQLRDEPIVEPLAAALGIPVFFGHDVRAAALAELHAGAALDVCNAAFIGLGTGIGAAFIIDGEIRSADGFMGEIGHQWVGLSEPCACGLSGCLEAVSSGAAIARRYAALSGEKVDAAEVVSRANSGEPTATEVWNDAITGLVRACSMVTNLLAPEIIILGGGLARAGTSLLTPLATGLASTISYQRLPELRDAMHRDDAGCLGAAIAALRHGGLS